GGGAVEQIRAGHQPTDRKDARADRAGKAARGRRRGDRITKLLAAPAHGSFWHIATNLTAAWHVRNRGTTGPSPEAQSTRMTPTGLWRLKFAVMHTAGHLTTW